MGKAERKFHKCSITCEIATLITNDVEKGRIYRFTPEFFDNPNAGNGIVSSDIKNPWQPLHPNQINAAEKDYQASHPVENNWNFALIALGAVIAVSALATLAAALVVAWYALPVLAAVFVTSAACVGIGAVAYVAYDTFFKQKKKLEDPQINIQGELNFAAR